MFQNISFELLKCLQVNYFRLSYTLQQPLDGINENSQYKRALMAALDVIYEQKRKQIVKLHQKFVLFVSVAFKIEIKLAVKLLYKFVCIMF